MSNVHAETTSDISNSNLDYIEDCKEFSKILESIHTNNTKIKPNEDKELSDLLDASLIILEEHTTVKQLLNTSNYYDCNSFFFWKELKLQSMINIYDFDINDNFEEITDVNL